MHAQEKEHLKTVPKSVSAVTAACGVADRAALHMWQSTCMGLDCLTGLPFEACAEEISE